MDEDLEQLASQGLVAKMASGKDGLRVSLQYQPRLSSKSLDERRQVLEREFAARTQDPLVEVDQDSLSVTGQSVEALVAANDYEDVRRSLEASDLRVDLARWHQVT
jgi:hypothetical protein